MLQGNDNMKLCKILGIPVINRSMDSCSFKTSFCSEHCYNNKFLKSFSRDMLKSAINDENYWNSLSPSILKADLSHIRVSNNRIRLAGRGEVFDNKENVMKVKSFMEYLSKYLFWIPTRAWKAKKLKVLIERELKILPNNRIMASIDPSNTQKEIDSLKGSNWSTMFFGDNNDTEGRVKCPKTWLKKKGITTMHRTCRYCNICFGKERVDVHLKKH